MIRKAAAGLLAAAICAFPALSGCSLGAPKDDGKLLIVTTSFPPYDFARAVAGDSANVEMLLNAGAEAHSYEPTPLDIAKISKCDVFVCIGGEDEVWVDKILDTINTDDIKVIKLFDYAELLEEEDVPGASADGHHHHHHHHEHDEEDDEHDHDDQDEDDRDEDHDDHDREEEVGEYEADGHIWTSPENAARCVRGLEEAMSAAFPDKAELFRAGGESYASRLDGLDARFRETIGNAPENVIVVGDRFPFRYLAHDYGLEYFAAFSGCSSESEPSIRTMAYLIDEIKEHDIGVVFYLEFSTKKIAEKLSAATGADILPLYACHSVSREDFGDGTTYADLMEINLKNLREALY